MISIFLKNSWRSCCMTIAALSLCSGFSVASLPEAAPVQEAGVCTAEETSPDAGVIPVNPNLKIGVDHSCAIDYAGVKKVMQDPKAYLIDTRTESIFNAFHVPSALRMSPADVMTKSYLADRKIILSGDGKAESSLYQLCATLKDKGFQEVHVLRGGMYSWVKNGGAVVGQPPAAADMARLMPGELLLETMVSESIYVVLPNAKAIATYLPAGSFILQKKGAPLSALLRSRMKSGQQAAMSIIVIGGDEASVSLAAKEVSAVSHLPVFVYEKGVADFMAAVASQKMLLAAKEKPPRTPCSRI